MQADSAVDQMGASVARSGKSMSGRNSFIFQNTANQLGDIAVQASMGTNIFRVLGMQLPQIAGGFALLGGAVGIVAPLLGVIAAIGFPILAVMTSFGQSSGKAAEELDKVSSAINDLKGLDKIINTSITAPINDAADATQRLIDRLRRQKFEVVRGGVIEGFSKSLEPFKDQVKDVQSDINSLLFTIGRMEQIKFENRTVAIVKELVSQKDQVEQLNLQLQESQQVVDAVMNAISDSTNARSLAENLLAARDAIENMGVDSAELLKNFDAVLESSGLQNLLLEKQERLQIRITKQAKEQARIRDEIVKRNRQNFQVEASVAVQEQRIAELRKQFSDKQAELNKKEPLKKTTNQIKQLTPEIKNLKTAVDMIGTSFERSFMSAVTGTASVKDAFRSMAANIIAELFRIFVVKQITGFITNLATSALVGAPQGPTLSGAPLPIYEGGGYTGNAPRTGGLDGRGGFMAMLHPNETVIDHSKGNSGGEVVVNQTINVTTGVQQTVRTEIQTLLPQIAEASKAAVLDARRRGGSFANAF